MGSSPRHGYYRRLNERYDLVALVCIVQAAILKNFKYVEIYATRQPNRSDKRFTTNPLKLWFSNY